MSELGVSTNSVRAMLVALVLVWPMGSTAQDKVTDDVLLYRPTDNVAPGSAEARDLIESSLSREAVLKRINESAPSMPVLDEEPDRDWIAEPEDANENPDNPYLTAITSALESSFIRPRFSNTDSSSRIAEEIERNIREIFPSSPLEVSITGDLFSVYGLEAGVNVNDIENELTSILVRSVYRKDYSHSAEGSTDLPATELIVGTSRPAFLGGHKHDVSLGFGESEIVSKHVQFKVSPAGVLTSFSGRLAYEEDFRALKQLHAAEKFHSAVGAKEYFQLIYPDTHRTFEPNVGKWRSQILLDSNEAERVWIVENTDPESENDSYIISSYGAIRQLSTNQELFKLNVAPTFASLSSQESVNYIGLDNRPHKVAVNCVSDEACSLATCLYDSIPQQASGQACVRIMEVTTADAIPNQISVSKSKLSGADAQTRHQLDLLRIFTKIVEDLNGFGICSVDSLCSDIEIWHHTYSDKIRAAFCPPNVCQSDSYVFEYHSGIWDQCIENPSTKSTVCTHLGADLSVAAHEFGHGIFYAGVEKKKNLIFSFRCDQPLMGPVIESYADLFSSFYRVALSNGSPSDDSWTYIGKHSLGPMYRNVLSPDKSKHPNYSKENYAQLIRQLKEAWSESKWLKAGGMQPGHIKDFVDAPVCKPDFNSYINSGIPNRVSEWLYTFTVESDAVELSDLGLYVIGTLVGEVPTEFVCSKKNHCHVDPCEYKTLLIQGLDRMIKEADPGEGYSQWRSFRDSKETQVKLQGRLCS